MAFSYFNSLPEQERITVRQAYETLKLSASTFEIAMQTDSDCGSDEHLLSATFDAGNDYDVQTMLAVYGDFLVDCIDPGDKYEGENAKYKGKNNFIVFLTMTPVIWGKPIKKQ